MLDLKDIAKNITSKYISKHDVGKNIEDTVKKKA